MFLRNSTTTDARRGVILIVVLALLTLFAIVGLSFVLYAQSEAESSRLFREDRTLRRDLESPDPMWSFALSKLLYDEFDDGSGVYSALRGHSLARSMYGFDNYIGFYLNPQTPAYIPNQTPFNGTGRNALATVTNPLGVPETQLVNYMYFQADGQLHDPERLGWRGANANPGPITGGFNVPYTYPDLNNMFLGAINAGGQVLMPSFHRPWLFGAIDPNSQPTGANPNPNWTNAQGKYLTLRPRPFDMSPAFPYPEDGGGDVKNLYWLPGGNDSIWMDIGYPVQVGPDGRKYKPLFAFFITDLDNRINLNVHGNMRGQTMPTAAGFSPGAPFFHVSNQGWGKWEVNLGAVLNSQNPGALSLNNTVNPPTINGPEWLNLFLGTGDPTKFNYVTMRGRYGWDFVPDDPQTYGTGGNYSQPGAFPHVYGQVDFDGCQQNFTPTQQILLPGQVPAWGPYNAFPAFPAAGYDNGGGGANNNAERVNHPLIYDFFRPFNVPAGSVLANPTPLPPDNRPAPDDRALPVSEMKELLNGNLVKDPFVTAAYGPAPQMAANAMKSQLGMLLPFNFNDPLDIAGSLRRRSLVTTHSMDIDQPGIMPWMWNADLTDATGNFLVASQIQGQRAFEDPVMSRPPWGNPSNFPDPMTFRAGGIPFNSEFGVQSPPPSVAPYPPGTPYSQSNWRAVTNGANPPFNTNVLGLGAPLPASALAAIKPLLGRLDLSRALTPYPPNLRFDDGTAGTAAQFAQAQTDRQALAGDIYRALRKIVGVQSIPVADQAAPTEAELMPRRWLAQFAVNIVDFIDSDDISTPFNFYPDNEPVNPPTDVVKGQNPSTSNTFPAEIFKYWVFGTELPRIVVNEVFAEASEPAPAAGATVTVNLWAELVNTMPAIAPAAGQGPWDATDANNIILYVPTVPGANPPNGYAPYRVVIAAPPGPPPGAGGPLTPRTAAAGLVLPATTTVGNDNVLGTPHQIRTETVDDAGVWTPPAPAAPPILYPTAAAFSLTAYLVSNGAAGNTGALGPSTNNPPMSLAPGQFLLIGAGTNPGTFTQDVNKTIPAYLGTGALAIPTKAMSYQVTDFDGKGTWQINKVGINDNGMTPAAGPTGVNVLLRRLANPHLPPNMDPTSPLFNPYITTDFMESIKVNQGANPPTYMSRGKLQPYAAALTQTAAQTQTVGATTVPHTLGILNNNSGKPAPAYDWLVHLDRQLVSPIELLHVSGYHPHELTHRFITATPDTTDPTAPKFGHRVRWFDQTTRLYRFLEFVEVLDRAYGMTSDGSYSIDPATGRPYGVSSIGRRPGRINLNTVWDQEIINALLDPQSSNYFNATDVTLIYNRLVNGRTPNYFNATSPAAGPPQPLTALGSNDRPFYGMGAGNISGPIINPPNPPVPQDAFYPNGTGINDTFLRVADMTQVPPTTADPPPAPFALYTAPGQGRPDLPRLFENTQAFKGGVADPVLSHPYVRFEPLNKIYNNLTSRSNVFAVWCTIGYFEVLDDTARPVKLGAEIGKAAGTNIRHRFFSVIDRTQMVIARNLLNSANGPGGAVVNQTNPLVGPGQVWVELDVGTGLPLVVTNNPGVIIGLKPNPRSSQPWNIITSPPPMLWSISAGSVLVVDRGTANEEWVQVTAIWQRVFNNQPPNTPPQSSANPVWIQASFIRPHNPGFSITEPGNPGPQLPLDVRDYFHAPVIPVSVTIEPGP
jgi:hypothetical protein